MNNRDWDAMLRRKAEQEVFHVNENIEKRIRCVIDNPETVRTIRRSSRRGLALGLAAAALLCAAALAVGYPKKDITNEDVRALTQPEEPIVSAAATIEMPAAEQSAGAASPSAPTAIPLPTATPIPAVTASPTVTERASVTPVPLDNAASSAALEPTPVPAATGAYVVVSSLAGVKDETVMGVMGVPECLMETSLSAHYAGWRLDIEATVQNVSDTEIAYAVWQPVIESIMLDAQQVSISETECLLLPRESFTFSVSYNISNEMAAPENITVGHRLKEYYVTVRVDQIKRLTSLAAPGDEDYAQEQAELLKLFSEGALLTVGTGQLYLPDGVAEERNVYSALDGYRYNVPKSIEISPTIGIAQWNAGYSRIPYFDENAAPLATARGDGYEWRLMRVSDYKNPYIVIDAVFDSEDALRAFEAAKPMTYCSAGLVGETTFSGSLRLGQFDGNVWQDGSGVWHCTGMMMHENVTGMNSGDTIRCYATYRDDETGKRVRFEGEDLLYVLP